MSGLLDTVLLIALPASGKSEVRTYLGGLEPAVCERELHLGPTLQLDDFPYVHLMRRIDEELEQRGAARAFFRAGDRPFIDPIDWGTLIVLLNQDYLRLLAGGDTPPPRAAAGEHFFTRLEAARRAVGGDAPFAKLPATLRGQIAAALEAESAELHEQLASVCSSDRRGKTVVIEFARGGADGASMPLPAPFGYRYSLSLLAPEILERAAILYIWVTPEESRRKNRERTDPNDPGSILHHGVPHEVMMVDYGCDDIEWLLAQSDVPGTIVIEQERGRYRLPLARFDNRRDRTSFVRTPRAQWAPADVAALHSGLARACADLAARDRDCRPRRLER